MYTLEFHCGVYFTSKQMVERKNLKDCVFSLYEIENNKMIGCFYFK